jgi:hypothetical protein
VIRRLVVWAARRACRYWVLPGLHAGDYWTLVQYRAWALRVTRDRPDIRPGHRTRNQRSSL